VIGVNERTVLGVDVVTPIRGGLDVDRLADRVSDEEVRRTGPGLGDDRLESDVEAVVRTATGM